MHLEIKSRPKFQNTPMTTFVNPQPALTPKAFRHSSNTPRSDDGSLPKWRWISQLRRMYGMVSVVLCAHVVGMVCSCIVSWLWLVGAWLMQLVHCHAATPYCCLHLLNKMAKSHMRDKHQMDCHQSATLSASSWILLQDVIQTLPTSPCHHFAPTVVPPDPFMLQRLLRRQAL